MDGQRTKNARALTAHSVSLTGNPGDPTCRATFHLYQANPRWFRLMRNYATSSGEGRGYRPGSDLPADPTDEDLMNMIYNSDAFCVVEFDLDDDMINQYGGFEIMDKTGRREAYIGGMLAERFRVEVLDLVEQDTNQEEIDEYLSGFICIMQHPLLLH